MPAQHLTAGVPVPDRNAASELDAALGAQHAALLSGDAARVASSSRQLAAALDALRTGSRGGASGLPERGDLIAMRDRLLVNASLLARRRAATERMLGELFGSESTYGREGATGMSSPQRRIADA